LNGRRWGRREMGWAEMSNGDVVIVFVPVPPHWVVVLVTMERRGWLSQKHGVAWLDRRLV
jgi:hypothetical protein